MMLIGSCFAGNIGTALLANKFNVDVNPFGVQYNPLSIATVLSRIVDGTPFDDASPELFEHGGKWHSILHHSDFSHSSKEGLINGINELKARVGIKNTIADYGVKEEDFLATLDEMTEQAFDDQCTGANPRYPLFKEIKQMYLNAYYGNNKDAV